jgi:hypothetical protein
VDESAAGTAAKRMRPLAKPNYQHEKRQKDLAKKKKKEEKLRRKAEKANSPKEENPEIVPSEGEVPPL